MTTRLVTTGWTSCGGVGEGASVAVAGGLVAGRVVAVTVGGGVDVLVGADTVGVEGVAAPVGAGRVGKAAGSAAVAVGAGGVWLGGSVAVGLAPQAGWPAMASRSRTMRDGRIRGMLFFSLSALPL